MPAPALWAFKLTKAIAGNKGHAYIQTHAYTCTHTTVSNTHTFIHMHTNAHTHIHRQPQVCTRTQSSRSHLQADSSHQQSTLTCIYTQRPTQHARTQTHRVVHAASPQRAARGLRDTPRGGPAPAPAAAGRPLDVHGAHGLRIHGGRGVRSVLVPACVQPVAGSPFRHCAHAQFRKRAHALTKVASGSLRGLTSKGALVTGREEHDTATGQRSTTQSQGRGA